MAVREISNNSHRISNYQNQPVGTRPKGRRGFSEAQSRMECDTTHTNVEFSHITGLFLHTLIHTQRRLSIVPITRSLAPFQCWLVFRNTVKASKERSLASSVSSREIYKK